MVANTPVRNLIRDGKIHLLSNVIQTHGDIGMVSLDESLAELYRKGTITYETAEAFCRDVDQLYQLIYRTAPAKTSKHG
jgi:twitching motility protein PilT